jgi:hypothetical protein
MSSRHFRRGVKGLSVGLVALSVALMAAGTVAAHTGSPSGITVIQTSSLTIQASGTWSWPAEASASTLSYVGYAIDWGDVSSGNALGTFHIGDGTSATNVILQPTSPAQGTSGTWGPVSHTYALPGTYSACVIIFDLGTSKPFTTTGYHSTQAGGTNHNTDNSVDHNQQTSAMCAQFSVVGQSPSPSVIPTLPPTAAPSGTVLASASPTPFESFAGATGTPDVTAPPTGTSTPSAPDQGAPALPLVLVLLGSSLASLVVFKTTRMTR